MLWCEVKARRDAEPNVGPLWEQENWELRRALSTTSARQHLSIQPAPAPVPWSCQSGPGPHSGSVLCEEIVFSERPSQEESGGLGWKKSLPLALLGVCDGPQREERAQTTVLSLGYTVNHLGV